MFFVCCRCTGCGAGCRFAPFGQWDEKFIENTTTMSTFNVLRYSLLGAGLVYGAVHRYSLESEVKEQQRISQWNKELKLIKQAKEEYARTHAVAEKPQASAGSINWEDPNLDIGKALESLVQKLD
ncbi:F1F0 ATP synthase subunit e, mitochondrial [Meyerozyma guilliermondii]